METAFGTADFLRQVGLYLESVPRSSLGSPIRDACVADESVQAKTENAPGGCVGAALVADGQLAV